MEMRFSEWGDEYSCFSDEGEQTPTSPRGEERGCISPKDREGISAECPQECCRETVKFKNCSCIRHKFWWHQPCRATGGIDTQNDCTTRVSRRCCTHGKNEEDDQGEKEYAEISKSIRGGIPVSVLMMHYPLSFCDVDLPFTLELKRTWREIGSLAFWTLSSAKDGKICTFKFCDDQVCIEFLDGGLKWMPKGSIFPMGIFVRRRNAKSHSRCIRESCGADESSK